MVEVNLNFPPPFRFASRYDEASAEAVVDLVTGLETNASDGGRGAYPYLPLSGCNLQYALDVLALRGYGLLRVAGNDAFFVRNDLGFSTATADRIYRGLRLWVTAVTIRAVREWFFGDPVSTFPSVQANVSLIAKVSSWHLPIHLSF